MPADTDEALVNQLGALALAVDDNVSSAIADSAGHGASEAGALVLLGSWPDLGMIEIGTALDLTQSAMVRVIDRLARDGLVRRTAGRDRRTVRLALTAAGRRRRDKVLTARLESLRGAVAELPDRDQVALARILKRLLPALSVEQGSWARTCRLCDLKTCRDGDCPFERG
jgi:DNA-binding MarR family transcriptional regulator